MSNFCYDILSRVKSVESYATIPKQSFCDLGRIVCLEAAENYLTKQEVIKLMGKICEDETKLQAFILDMLEKVNVFEIKPAKLVCNVSGAKKESESKVEDVCFNCGGKKSFFKKLFILQNLSDGRSPHQVL